MKRILFAVLLISLFSCKEDLEMVLPIPTDATQTKIDTTKTTPVTPPVKEQARVGMFVDSVWFAKNYNGYKKITIHWFAHGDFNKDGYKDMVMVFASNGTQDYNYQDDLSKRIVVGVFINRKTYFELDTNLVYSQLGGWNGANVSDVDNDGDLDIYQMTGIWEGSSYKVPSYYTGNNNDAMDSFLFLNENNKSFKKVVAPIEDCSGILNSILFDNDKNGYSEIYISNGDYYDFNGTSLIRKRLNIIKTFKGVNYDLRVITPKYADSKNGLLYLASDGFSDTYFILKVVGNNLIPIVKYTVPITMSGFSEGTNGERDEMYVKDLNGDGNDEYIISSQVFNTSTTWNTPYLLIIDSNGKDVTNNFLDASINNPLKYEQFNAGIRNITGFIYYTYCDIDGDGFKEIFAASGLGYLESGNSYYFKFIDGKYRKVLYQNGWIGNVNNQTNMHINYWAFVDEKNKIFVFHVGEGSIDRIIVKGN